MRGSRISGFYRLPVETRRAELGARAGLGPEDLATLEAGGLDLTAADRLVENVVGLYALPLGLGLNFVINGRDIIVPMAVEEPSVIAAASNAARMVREGGGFVAEADPPIMTAQVELGGVAEPDVARRRIQAAAASLLALADASVPRLTDRGGGAREIDVRVIDGGAGGSACPRVIVHIHVDCRDAMGANLVNTVAESLAGPLAELAGGRSGLRILTNLADRRRVRAVARVPVDALATPDVAGPRVRDGIAAASRFAEDDPYRAATHNKGIMNGVDAVALATGNDWRGVEAGAHAFAAARGGYRPLATWTVDEAGDLAGRLEMPMAVGTVGGTLHAHPGARLCQKILGVRSAGELGMVIGCVGLASNLAALRALATDGIQRGHMALHTRAASLAQRPVSDRHHPGPVALAGMTTAKPDEEVV